MRVCIAQNASLTNHLALSVYLSNLVKSLSRIEDLEIILLISRGSKPFSFPYDNVNLIEIESNLYSICGNFNYAVQLSEMLKLISVKMPIDLLYCIYPLSSLLGAVLFKRRNPRLKVIYDVRSPWIDIAVERGSIPTQLSAIFKQSAYAFEKILMSNADGLVFITESLKHYYQKRVRISEIPIHIMPSGVDLLNFRSTDNLQIRHDFGIPDYHVVLGYVGGISSMRELDFIIRGFANALRKRSDLWLVFVGDGNDLERLKDLSVQMNCANRVIFMGRIDSSLVPYYISMFDVGLCHLPNKMVFRFSYPLKILEYLASGMKVFASNIDTHLDISRVFENVIIYEDIEDFTRKIVNFKKESKAVPAKIGDFSWDYLCGNLVRFWREILE